MEITITLILMSLSQYFNNKQIHIKINLRKVMKKFYILHFHVKNIQDDRLF